MMYRPPEEIAALKESFRKMDAAHKAEYIYTYYKWFIILGIIALVILGNAIHRQVTKKDVPLYVGLANVVVGPELEQTISVDFLEQQGLNPKKNEVLLYKELYLSDDAAQENHQYAYASNMKVMASVNAQKLDAVLMNREAYDLLSGRGYLMPLNGLSDAIAPFLVDNEVILESNALEVALNEADEYRIITETCTNGMDVTTLPAFASAGFDGEVYLGIIVNTPRMETVISYLEYLTRAS